MAVCIVPSSEETLEILRSATARKFFSDKRAMGFCTSYGGMKFSVALLQSGQDTEIKHCRFVITASERDLQDNLAPLQTRRK